MAERGRCLVRGALAGVVAGLAGSWLMLRFIEGPGARMLDGLKTKTERAREREAATQAGKRDKPAESVTMHAADVFASHAPGGRHLSLQERREGGTVVHYAFGALMGVAYGVTAEFWSLPTIGLGTAFGTVLWSMTDLWSVPAVGFAKWPNEEPPAAHVTHWMAHVVYGWGMEGTRRLVRRVM